MTAEIGLSGKAGSQRLRGTLHTGFAPPESLRLEAVAPFGGPFFLLAGTGGRATLLLPRENRVLRDAPAAEILEALAGLDQAPSDLRAWIVGCPEATGQASNLRSYGADWAAADLESGRTLWIHRVPVSQAGARGWRLVAVNAGPLTVEFSEHTGTQPGRLRIRRAASGRAWRPSMCGSRCARSNAASTLPDAAFAIDVPADAVPITIEELRQSGPLRDAKARPVTDHDGAMAR